MGYLPAMQVSTKHAVRPPSVPGTVAPETAQSIQNRRVAELVAPPIAHDLGHTLRGTAGMLGADAVAACAGELERDGNAPHQPIFESILRACSELETALREAKVAL